MTISIGRNTPFHDEHVKAEGRMIPISGWRRPVHYGSPDAEVHVTRNSAGLYDLHPMSRRIIAGPNALVFMQLLVTSDLQHPMRRSVAQYTCICNEAGGVIDDVLVFPMSEEEFLVTSGVAAAETLGAWIERWIRESGLDVQMRDISQSETQFAVQGPRSLELVRNVFGMRAANLKHMHFTQATFRGVHVFIARVGYSGEAGFEVFTDPRTAVELWGEFLLAGKCFGVAPFGIMAAQILRLEKGYLLHGVDMDSQNNPFEIGLEWTVALGKGGFLGGESLTRLKAEGIHSRIRKFYVEGSYALPSGTDIYQGGVVVGKVTSCSSSPTLDRVIGMGLFDVSIDTDRVCFAVRGDIQARLFFVEKSFYDPEGSRLKSSLS